MRRTKRVAVGVAMVIVLVMLGVAVAEWLANGTGTGTARAGFAEALTATGAEPTTLLVPGGTADVALTINNPNSFPVTVSSISGNGEITSDTAGCDSSNHAVTFADQSGSWSVAADGSSEVVLANAAAMGLDSATECQGATFTIPVSLNGGSGGGGLVAYYTGPAGTEGVGECRAGSKDADGNVVDPEVTPVAEVADGLDNDCDGAIDDGVVCDDGLAYTDDLIVDGVCTHTGNSAFDVDNDGFYAAGAGGNDCDDANSAVNPGAAEVVGNGIDDDCDGVVDEA